MYFVDIKEPNTEQSEHNNDSFLQGTASTYIDTMYTSWKADPTSVHVSWQAYFHNVENGHVAIEQAFIPPPELVSATSTILKPTNATHAQSETVKQLKAIQLIQAYQRWGHEHAKIDPLGMLNEGKVRKKELYLSHYGLGPEDLDMIIPVGLGAQDITATKSMTLREVITICEETYCGSMDVEYMHISDQEQVEWIRRRIEGPERHVFSNDEKKRILDGLVRTTAWEKFLTTKFPNEKRFGLDGVESYIPAFEAAVDRSAENGVEHIEMGVGHRGRMNALYNIVGKDGASMLRDFDSKETSAWGIPGDVKYHYGGSGERVTASGKKVYMNMAPQPSHVESVNPVVMGKTRAIQDGKNGDLEKTMMLNVHTDAAFAGQGTVYETLGLAALKGYEIGGTLRFIVNNQVGFTTDAWQARSSPYCTDVAKILDAPVIHVNGDDVEAVVLAGILAADFRATFKKDFLVDIVCYRRNGHNEMDQASFTQPTMYERIAEKKNILDGYEASMISNGVDVEEEVQRMKDKAWAELIECLDKRKDQKPDPKEWLIDSWKGMKAPTESNTKTQPPKVTAVSHESIEAVSKKLGAEVPQGFELHKNLERILSRRQQTVKTGKDIDWATAEALAFGTILREGTGVRVAGQDVERGTFSHRHAVLHDQRTNKTYTPLSTISPGQGLFTITNSSLSETAAMGFEFGYSLADPNALVMWEAQFGDFANNAQVIIDNYIASSEKKWLQRSGVVLSLPHGYDGQGPEHTSARLERFLQLGDEDSRHFPSPEQLQRQHQDANIQIVCMTSPANYFHVLRRQIHRDFRKPLIILFSKSLLRHPLARSDIEEFIETPYFQPLPPETQHGISINKPEDIKRVIFCSGQVYVALYKYRETHGLKDTAITRIEELHPFPWEQVRQNLENYPNATDVVWCQEETLNGGAWGHVMPRFEVILADTKRHTDKKVRYAGREPMSSVAVGYKVLHAIEEEKVMGDAFQVSPRQ
ncbi:2-oxoglutarate dehydrogenase family protein [Aspergillus vadensis CBS 113365]|uniref:2-oxoglutarate dehydrogenase, mitochondrial n=1 Tax=Aspergillus vadensis (strain CBS 113365 / IMI 142717 / IBT 24658) TaxID=1448311 RepID=A0A319BDV1_ASPVC|nr:alpha-ketoglutarate dehydrogenase complex subunit Kgd1 [Aspergillus vadensis CBS 113365]PYH70837.1 alpha-ketoglutarate dehydrogenase complex subunit Kgd1 [Aspergillus vadensis CBS 113365]